jgi:hypothetical protein
MLYGSMRPWFDGALMFRGRSLHVRVGLAIGYLLVISGACWLGFAGSVTAQAAVANLLAPAPAARAPGAELAEQLSQLARRPFADDHAVQAALVQARIELAALDAAQGANDAALQRRTALVWAALSWADRLQARVHTAAALAGLQARARAAEDAALRARPSTRQDKTLVSTAAGSGGIEAAGGSRIRQQPSAAEPLALALARAHEVAPDYVARVRAAQAAATAERMPAARDEQQKRVSFLTGAALAEAERLALVRQVDGCEQRIAVARAARAEEEQASRELSGEQRRAAAAQQERADAEWVFAALAQGLGDKPADRDRIAGFLLRRARALLAAARALGADAGELGRADQKLTAAVGGNVARARAALAGAARALGSARSRMPEPSAAERADLSESLRERGFTPHVGADGLQIELAAAGRAHTDTPRQLAGLAELLPAFPHGAIGLTCAHPTSPAQCGALAGFAPPERARVQLQPAAPALPGIRLALPAYRERSSARGW